MTVTDPSSLSAAERLNRECFCIGTDVAAVHRWLEDDLSHGLTRPVIDPVYRTVLIPAFGIFGVMFGTWYIGIG